MAYHFFECYAKIDCNLGDRFEGDAKKRHLKAYEDLVYLLTKRKALAEQYFCVQISRKVFRQLCNGLYHEDVVPTDATISGAVSHSTELNNTEVHLPYSLGCRFSDEAVKMLYRTFVAHEVFYNLTVEKVKALFDGSLSTDIKCCKATRFGYIMHHLSVGGLITNQYQKAIDRCGYIIVPSSDGPMTAANLKEAVKRAHVYSKKDDHQLWKRTINLDLNRLFNLTGIPYKLS